MPAFAAPHGMRARFPEHAPKVCARRGRAPRMLAKVSVEDGVEGGRGVVARGPVAGGEVVARVPIGEAMVVCFEDGAVDSAVDGFPFGTGEWVGEGYWRGADWDCKLCVLLLWHVRGGGKGWEAYVRGLPGVDGAGGLFTAADLQSGDVMDLQYGPMVDAVECYQYRVGVEYERLRGAMPPAVRDLVRRCDFEWAMKVVHSRAFSIPPGGFAASSTRTGLRSFGPTGAVEWPRKFALVPVLDMMNHGTGDDLAKFRFDAEGDAFELVAGKRGYQPGSQVLVSYGDLTNDDLFLLYGFVQAGNPSDVYEVEDVSDWVVDHPINRAWNVLEAKLNLLETASLCYEGRKFHIARAKIDPDLVAALRVLLADPKEFQAARTAVKARADSRSRDVPDLWHKPLSMANELRVWQRIQVQCRRVLDEFPTSLELDEEMIILHAASSVPSDLSVSTPLLFRAEKKRILRDAAELAATTSASIEAAILAGQTVLSEGQSIVSPPPVSDAWEDFQ